MKTALFLRHAKSSWKEPGLADHERPLNKRGRRAAARMGALLAEEGLRPDGILSSTALRARDTAERVARAAGFEGEIERVAALYLAAPDEILAVLAEAPEAWARTLLVGHNPGCAEVVARLGGQPEVFPTAALAAFALDVGTWREVSGLGPGRARRIGRWRPRELEAG